MNSPAPLPTARYSVEHLTRYDYSLPVSLSQQLLHLSPRSVPWQDCLDWQLHCDPQPTRQRLGEDAFGNPLNRLEFASPHRQLSIEARMRVAVGSRRDSFDPCDSPPWELAREAHRFLAGVVPDEQTLDACRYRFRSPYVPISSTFRRYAEDCFVPERPLLLAAQALMAKIHSEFQFDASATQIATPLAEVLRQRRGVCQDFAHLMIACLRSLDLPARYVSGYLLTAPPPGQPRMVGADASHAWVAVRCPLQGWVEFDPTNNVLPDSQHIVLCWGRDFGDVSPLRGVILGGGTHEPRVAVTVTPLEG
jgi:transglutaminase-like putative cysteine protease